MFVIFFYFLQVYYSIDGLLNTRSVNSIQKSQNIRYFYTMKAMKVGTKKVKIANHEMKQITLIE